LGVEDAFDGGVGPEVTGKVRQIRRGCPTGRPGRPGR
jgi:hypothetical protein